VVAPFPVGRSRFLSHSQACFLSRKLALWFSCKRGLLRAVVRVKSGSDALFPELVGWKLLAFPALDRELSSPPFLSILVPLVEKPGHRSWPPLGVAFQSEGIITSMLTRLFRSSLILLFVEIFFKGHGRPPFSDFPPNATAPQQCRRFVSTAPFNPPIFPQVRATVNFFHGSSTSTIRPKGQLAASTLRF